MIYVSLAPLPFLRHALLKKKVHFTQLSLYFMVREFKHNKKIMMATQEKINWDILKLLS